MGFAPMLAGFVASPVAVGFLQLGAPWVLRLAFVVFLLGGVAAMRLPEDSRPRCSPSRRQRRPTAGPSRDRPPPTPAARGEQVARSTSARRPPHRPETLSAYQRRP